MNKEKIRSKEVLNVEEVADLLGFQPYTIRGQATSGLNAVSVLANVLGAELPDREEPDRPADE